jgi:hypothetical protein
MDAGSTQEQSYTNNRETFPVAEISGGCNLVIPLGLRNTSSEGAENSTLFNVGPCVALHGCPTDHLYAYF